MRNKEILAKIKKLKSKLKKKNQIVSSSSDTESDSDVVRPPPRKRIRIESSDSDCSGNSISRDENTVREDHEEEDIISSILGEDPTLSKEFGEDIHSHLAVRWNNILHKGLKKVNRTDLIKKYLPPANCPLIKPPRLNDEIKAASQENTIKRDLKLEQKQSQLGAGITCIGKGMELVLQIADKELRNDIIKYLGDGGQILTDLHYLESMTRRSLLVQSLNKTTKEAIKDLPRDQLLFGEILSEKLKATKACSKSVEDMRVKTKTSASRVRVENRTSGPFSTPTALNWRGSSHRPATTAYPSRLNAGSYRERRQTTATTSPAPRRAQASQRPHPVKRN